MFYSHEILTSRKYGVATVWLVATLGSKSSLRKVNRKAILDVNVPKACEVIVAPEAPMALRLQSNLLYGVSRVYSQQCGYVLVDAQNTQNNLRQLIRKLRDAGGELDPQAGKTKPELLLLRDDPSFVPDFAFTSLGFDADLSLDPSTTDASASQSRSLLTPRTMVSSQSSHVSVPGIRIPTSESAAIDAGADLDGFNISRSDTSSRNDRLNALARNTLNRLGEDDGFLPEADFVFDAEGNLHDIDTAGSIRPQPNAPSQRQDADGDDSAIRDGVRLEHEDAWEAGLYFDFQDTNMVDTVPSGFDQFVLPEAEAFPKRQGLETSVRSNILNSPLAEDRPQSGQDGRFHMEEPSEQAEAAMKRQPRARKPIPLDEPTQISNKVIRSWNDNYVENMSKAATLKKQKPLGKSTKKSEHYLWDRGLGGVGVKLGPLGMATPLDMFFGEMFKEQMMVKITAPQKRGHNSVAKVSEEPERRVRQRTEYGEEVGRGEGVSNAEHDGFDAFGDDEDLEVGRNMPTPLPEGGPEDNSAVMPWNLSASQRSSTLIQGRSAPLGHSAIGSLSSASPAHISLGQSHRRGRLTSASPLLGRGSNLPDTLMQSGLRAPSSTGSRDNGHELLFENDSGAFREGEDEVGSLEEFELMGPDAKMDSQVAAASQWTQASLDNEGANFLEFLQKTIKKVGVLRHHGAELGDDETMTAGVTFETLLPPPTNSKIVAAQALLHCLSLATTRLIKLNQIEHFGAITLSIPGLVHAAET